MTLPVTCIKQIGLDTILAQSSSTIEGIVNLKSAFNINIVSRSDMKPNDFYFEDNNIIKNFYVNINTDPNKLFESLMLSIYYNTAYSMIDVDNSIYDTYKVMTDEIIKSLEHVNFECSKPN